MTVFIQKDSACFKLVRAKKKKKAYFCVCVSLSFAPLHGKCVVIQALAAVVEL